MCGIAGIIGNYNKEDQNKILQSMKHRGPDGNGLYDNKNFCFIHTLLKIMDLSNKSLQPMIDENNGNVIIFNGSIYNYKDLKKKFFFNQNFKSNTDTEILLKLYSKFGIDFLKYLKGMFAIAIYDKKLNKIFIIRDRFGIKPLFYFSNLNFFIFASEIKILTKNHLVKNSLSLDQKEVIKFIANRQMYGFDKTLISNIKILKPGNYIEYDLNKKIFKTVEYFDKNKILEPNKKNNKDYFEEIFAETVKYHTITEHKKIACLLSGGLDSSLLSIILKEQSKDKEIHTFSSMLNTSNDENKNIPTLIKENKFIEHFVYEDSVDFFEDHIKTINDLDQPTPDASTTLHNILCKEVSKEGFKVLFTGNGGDENFFGYSLHTYGYLANMLSKKQFFKFYKKIKQFKNFYEHKNIIIRSIKELINIEILNKFKKFQLKKKINHLDLDTDIENTKFYEKLSDNIFDNIVLNYKSHWGMQSFLDYEDKNSMAYGVECRVPYLYEDINDLSLKTALDDHFKNGPKSLLRNHSKMPKYIKNKSKYAFAANLEGYLDKDINKIKEKIFYEFKEIPLINIDKLIKLSNNKRNYDIFFRTYSYGLWYNRIFNQI